MYMYICIYIDKNIIKTLPKIYDGAFFLKIGNS